jgi:hypothetical protein
MPKGIQHSHLISDSGGRSCEGFTRKMVKSISVPKGCTVTAGENVKVQEENKVQMAGACIS